MHATRRFVRFASVLSLLSLAAAPLHAQRFGFIAGGTFSNLRSSDDLDFERRTGTTFGASLQLPLGSMITLQPEALFLNKGAKFKRLNEDGTSNVRLDYFEIPVLLRYDISREFIGPHIYAGPSIGFNTGCKVKLSGNSSLPTTDGPA